MAQDQRSRRHSDGSVSPPRDERVAQIARGLPTSTQLLMTEARLVIRQYDQAVRDCDERGLKREAERYEAIIWRLNGGTFFGCYADEGSPGTVLERELAAPSGEAPLWGQAGEFLTEVHGMRVWVKTGAQRGGLNTQRTSFNAVDFGRPFISETGYQSHSLPVMGGLTVRQAIDGILGEHGYLQPKEITHDQG